MMTSTLAQHVLAAMLSLAPPGTSAYSRTVVPDCDKACQATRVCDDPGTICDAPTFSKYHRAHTRQENADEGLQRYAGIAEAIATVASSTPEWTWEARELADLLTTTSFFESRYRKDVHAGVGPAAYGDCSYHDPKTFKSVKADFPNAVRSCRAGCLVQLNVHTLRKISGPERLGLRDVVGLSRERTELCLGMGARYLAHTRGLNRHSNWVTSTFAAYGGLFVGARVSTYGKVKGAPSLLPQAVLDQLGVPDT